MFLPTSDDYQAGKKFLTKDNKEITEHYVYYRQAEKKWYLPEAKYIALSEIIAVLNGERTVVPVNSDSVSKAKLFVGIDYASDDAKYYQPIASCYSPGLFQLRVELGFVIVGSNPIVQVRPGFEHRLLDLVTITLEIDPNNTMSWAFSSPPQSKEINEPYFKNVLSIKENASCYLEIFGFNSMAGADYNCYLACFKLAIHGRKLQLYKIQNPKRKEFDDKIKKAKSEIKSRINTLSMQCATLYFSKNSSQISLSLYKQEFSRAAMTLFCFDYLWPFYDQKELDQEYLNVDIDHVEKMNKAYAALCSQRMSQKHNMFLGSSFPKVRERARSKGFAGNIQEEAKNIVVAPIKEPEAIEQESTTSVNTVSMLNAFARMKFTTTADQSVSAGGKAQKDEKEALGDRVRNNLSKKRAVKKPVTQNAVVGGDDDRAAALETTTRNKTTRVNPSISNRK
jgi:hypothetical protein